MEKKLLIKIEISIAAITVLLFSSFLLAYFIQDNTNKKIIEQLQNIVNNYQENTYIVTEKAPFQTALTSIGNIYIAEKENSEKQSYIALIRIMGISGPVSAVFLYDNNYTSFIDFAGISNARSYKNHGINNSQISYWEKTINDIIISNTTVQGENNE